ncbi:hypothetical protein, partial [Alicyclobacillus sp. SP_1]|uniref:hypothetical protein n=1 Tax=Alicyclobacillus sp. SP_1 TaxID=2942475 RepID=UPI00215783B0
EKRGLEKLTVVLTLLRAIETIEKCCIQYLTLFWTNKILLLPIEKRGFQEADCAVDAVKSNRSNRSLWQMIDCFDSFARDMVLNAARE